MPLATVLATQPLSKRKSGVLIGNGAFLWVGFYHQSVLLVNIHELLFQTRSLATWWRCLRSAHRRIDHVFKMSSRVSAAAMLALRCIFAVLFKAPDLEVELFRESGVPDQPPPLL